MSENKTNDLVSEDNLESGAMPKAQRLTNLPVIIVIGIFLLVVIFIVIGLSSASDNQQQNDDSIPQESNVDLDIDDSSKITKRDGYLEYGTIPNNISEKAVIPASNEKNAPNNNEYEKRFTELEAKYNQLLLEKSQNVISNQNTDSSSVEMQRAIMELKREIAGRKKQAFFQSLTASSKTKVSGDVTNANGLPANATIDERKQDLQRKKAYANQQLLALQGGNGNTGSSIGSFSGGTRTLSSPNNDLPARYDRDRRITAPLDQTVDAYSNMERSSWKLDRFVETPESDFIVRAGFVIPATMISGINSDTAGQIMAQVTQNVYDTATGKYVLIPQGTRLVGTYNSGATFGQERIMIIWQRLVFPDNKVLDIGSMEGADTGGYAGFHDQVNNHWWKLISSAFLMSGITASVSIAVDRNSNKNNNNANSVNSDISSALAGQLGNVMARVIERNLNIAPTLEIRQGYNFNVMVTKDLIFDKPYSSFDYK